MFAAALVFPDPVVTKSKGAKVLPSLDSSFRWFWEKNSWTSWSARCPLLEGLGGFCKNDNVWVDWPIHPNWGKSGETNQQPFRLWLMEGARIVKCIHMHRMLYRGQMGTPWELDGFLNHGYERNMLMILGAKTYDWQKLSWNRICMFSR